MTDSSSINKTHMAIEDVNIIQFAKTIWVDKKTIFTVVFIFMIIGILVALFSQKEYLASSTIVPQLSRESNRMGGLSSLAAIAGFNVNANMETSELSPYVYPQIVQSTPFQLELMETTYTFSGVDHPVSLLTYYTEYYKPGIFEQVFKYTFGLPGIIVSAIRGKKAEVSGEKTGSTIQLTEQQDKVRKIIDRNVVLETNDKQGFLVLTVRFHEPLLAAQVAEKAKELLQKYITEFKIKKTSEQLRFVEERFNEKKRDFEKAQANLAAFRDRNKNVTSALARTEEERLQNEYQLSFEVYKQLAQQLEQARIKVKEDTPVFAVIKPVMVPIEKSKPKRAIILIIWTILGGLAGIGWVFGKKFYQSVKEKWNEEPVDIN